MANIRLSEEKEKQRTSKQLQQPSGGFPAAACNSCLLLNWPICRFSWRSKTTTAAEASGSGTSFSQGSSQANAKYLLFQNYKGSNNIITRHINPANIAVGSNDVSSILDANIKMTIMQSI